MGVMACDRRGCDNIMCDKLSSEYGYICNDCYIELLEADMSIAEFMNSEKKETYFEKKKDRRTEIKKEFVDI